MKTKVLTIDPQLPNEAVLRSAGKSVQKGQIVAFPTETVYGLACRVEKNALEKLDKAKNRPDEKRYTLVIPGLDSLKDYVPNISLRTQKLIKKFWPGPLTVVFSFDDGELRIQKKKFDTFIFETLYENSTLGVRCPLGIIPQKLLQYADCPVVAPSANLSGRQPASEAKEVLNQLEGRIEVLIDGGKCALKLPSTVIKVEGDNFTILREGAIKNEDIRTYSTIKILFVCTGNTCRSPMAEALAKKYLSEKYSSALDRTNDLGYKITSAGVMAAEGINATPEAIRACHSYGLDISSHKSAFLSENIVAESDLIYTMCKSHLDSIINAFPDAEDKVFTLAGGRDIFDPIGTSQENYDSCADLIYESIKKRFGEFLK